MNRRSIYIIALAVIAVAGSAYWYVNYLGKSGITQDETLNSSGCLKSNEYADYFVNKQNPDDRIAKIYIKEKGTNKILSQFQFDIISPRHYHPIEIHSCHVYAGIDSGYDIVNHKALNNYKAEIWRYDYQGNGESILLLGQMINGQYVDSGYDQDLRVSVDEKYITLIKGILDNEDYSLVFRNIETKQDEYIINLKDLITNKYTNIHPGSFRVGEWEHDHIWVSLSVGAYDTGYLRIERDPWKVEAFSPPENAVEGSEGALNDNGYLAYSDLTTFTGFAPTDKEIIDQAKTEGRKNNLFIYNLYTHEIIKIASVEPQSDFRYRLNWLSDTELEYYLTDGVRKVYTVK